MLTTMLALQAVAYAGNVTVGGDLAVTGKIGVYGTAPQAKPGAYTQTFATADKTHANTTAVAFPAGGTGAAAGGWDTSGNRDLAIARFAALMADVADLKQLVNSVIDDFQALGFLS